MVSDVGQEVGIRTWNRVHELDLEYDSGGKNLMVEGNENPTFNIRLSSE